MCLPANSASRSLMDVNNLGLHDGIRVRDLGVEGKWKPVSDGDLLIVHVVTVKAEPEPVAADAAAAAAAAAVPAAPAEPEVIKKGKVEKEEDE